MTKKSTTTSQRKAKIKSADKTKVANSFSELADSIISIADKLDKLDDETLKLYNKQERLTKSFDNLIEVLNANNDRIKPIQADFLNLREQCKNEYRGIHEFVSKLQKKSDDRNSYLTNRIDTWINNINFYNSKNFFKRLFSKI